MGWVCGMGSSGKEKRPPGSYGHQTEHPERVASGSEVYRGEGGAAVSATGGGATMHSAHSRRAGGGGILHLPGCGAGVLSYGGSRSETARKRQERKNYEGC